MTFPTVKTHGQYLHLILKHYGFSFCFDDDRSLLQRCSDFMIGVLKECQFSVKEPLDDPLIVNDSFVNECTIPFEITGYYGNNISNSFFNIETALKISLTELDKSSKLHKMNIRFASDQWFSEKLLSAHQNIATHSIFFATIIKGCFFEHWSVKRALVGMISTDFEYDRDHIVTEFYQDEKIRKGRDSDSRREDEYVRVKVQYMINVPFRHVQKIFVDEFANECFLLHFLLSSPPVVMATKYEQERQYKTRSTQIFCPENTTERKMHFKCSPKAISESPIYTVNIKSSRVYHILSRLNYRMKVPIEFSKVEHVLCTISALESPFHKNAFLKEHEQRQACEQFLVKNLEIDFERFPDDLAICAVPPSEYLVDECIYLIEALFSRGALVKCQLILDSDKWNNFRETVHRNFFQNCYACLEALKELLMYIDENILLDCLTESFDKLFANKKLVTIKFGLTEEEKKDGYVLLRKVVITPTRLILMPSEMVMGNRAVRITEKDIRQQEHKAFLRIAYRDEDGRRLALWKSNRGVVRKLVMDTFTKGINITGSAYYYIGSSSSQQREHGAYFMLGVLKSHAAKVKENEPSPHIYSINQIRKKLGRFENLDNIPKLMARLGQCFTQSRETQFKIMRTDYDKGFDIIGGSNSRNQPYTFSDGVGTMSFSFADKIRKEISLNSVPGCFQFRFRGMKGVLSVDRYLDEKALWAEENNVVESDKASSLLCKFRHSQEKFAAKRYSMQPVEIVKYSGVTSLYLNKPLIAVLDFATESRKTLHERIRNRINVMLDSDIRKIAEQLSSDFHCRQRLKEFPMRIDVDILDQRTGLNLSFEPFFRGMLLAGAYDSITKHLNKMRISIPNHLGRGMMGVLDETGRLQSGQVFFQYSSICSSYSPAMHCASTVHTGPVMITKSPTTVLGDVRIFEAVDIPELHHLRDVIVFPQHGIRPHPDEMAGSDLDGDEYSVIWDPELIIEENVPARSYSHPESIEQTITDDLILNRLNHECANFFVNVITQDAIGYISNCHLFNADMYHITSEVCESLAIKASTALDFAKTGVPAENLTKQWTRNGNGKWCPPESVEFYPDFSANKSTRPIYASDRWIGELYREVKKIEEYISEELKHEPVIEIDQLLIVDQWTDYKIDATTTFNTYLNELRSIMLSYRIQNEAELFSGHVTSNNHKMGDKGAEDQSYFNIKQVIDKRVSNLFKRYRSGFFDEFGGHYRYTESKFRHEESANILKRHVSKIIPEMRRKASAYYMVAYEHAIKTGERFLSFGWLLYDINADTRLTKILQSPEMIAQNACYSESIITRVQEECERVINSKVEEFTAFGRTIESDLILKKYCTKYYGLIDILFALQEWAHKFNLLSGRFTEKHLSHLFLRFSLNHFPTAHMTFHAPINEIEEKLTLEDLRKEEVNLVNPYRLLLSFFEYVSSLQFKKLENISFSSTGFKSVLMRGEWKPLHEEALKSYYTLLISLKFRILPVAEEKEATERIYDADPFCILVREDDYDLIPERLKDASGVKELSARSLGNGIMIVMARGSTSALKKLRELVVVRMDKYFASMDHRADELSNYLINKMMEKLNNLTTIN